MDVSSAYNKKRFFLFFIIFFIAPFCSFFFHSFFSDEMTFWMHVVVIGAYWVFPWLICIFLLLRKRMPLIIYFLQCIFLILHSVMFRHFLPFELEICRYVFIFCMIYMGYIFIEMDKPNFLRKNFRIEVKTNCELIHKNIPINVDLQDCSTSGLGIKISNEQFMNYIGTCAKGDNFKVVIKIDDSIYDINCWVAWFFNYGSFWRIGFFSDDIEKLGAYINALYEKENAISPIAVNEKLNALFNRTGYVLWVLFIALSYSMPFFSKFLM